MLKSCLFLPLFKRFIAQSNNGKRLNKNGSRIKPQTVQNCGYCLKLLEEYSVFTTEELLVYEVKGSNKREHAQLKKYYGKFYTGFTGYLYKEKKCHDNYTGQNIKMIRTFFNWLNESAGIHTGPYYKNFHIVKEETAIQTLTIQQLQFLLFDLPFHNSLSLPQQQAKDVFVIGCLTGLRFSDLRQVKKENIEQRDDSCYLKMRSQKTSTYTLVKLPEPAVAIFQKYWKRKGTLLPVVSLSRFNQNIKNIGALAGWIQPVFREQSRKGAFKLKMPFTTATIATRFCDLLSSHTMRRTGITTMLTSGMPEYIVRRISGHTSDSKAFFRYVNLAQSLMDTEIDKMHRHFQAVTV